MAVSAAVFGAPFGELRLIDRLREDGPYELWRARRDSERDDARVVLRRIVPALARNPSLRSALEAGTRAARRVAHQNVILCRHALEIPEGLVQISEDAHDVGLVTLIARGDPRAEPLDVRLAVWIARQILEAAAHAESLGIIHGNLAPKHVYASRDGTVRADFGLAMDGRTRTERTSIAGLGEAIYAPPALASATANARPTSLDAYAVACILWEMLSAQPYAECAREGAWAHYVPLREGERVIACRGALDGCLRRVLEGGRHDDARRDAKALLAALSRVFYADLDADDEHDGRAALIARIAVVHPEAAAAMARRTVHVLSRDARTNTKGAFTRILEERAGPVSPKPLTGEDIEAITTPKSAEIEGPEARTLTPLPDPPTDAPRGEAPAPGRGPLRTSGVHHGVPSATPWFVAGFLAVVAALLVLELLARIG